MSKNEKVWTILSMLEWATDYFQIKEVPDPRLSIEWLLAETLNIKRLDLYLQFDRPLTESELKELRTKVKRRSLHEPLQYITGYSEFHGCRIEVNPTVLIPRVETEQLVEIILADQSERKEQNLDVLDIGTGSGCIPIALAKSVPAWRFTAIDNSAEALTLAKNNADLNQAEIEFIQENIFNLAGQNELSGRSFDLIISNPPYILEEEKESMEKQVYEFEPPEALFHQNPLRVYEIINEFSFQNLKETGTLYLECNDKLTGRIAKDMKNRFSTVDILNDYDNNERFIRAVKNS